MKVLNGNAVSSVISEKMCGQTNTQTNKQTNRTKIVWSPGTGDYNKQTNKRDKNNIVTGVPGDYN